MSVPQNYRPEQIVMAKAVVPVAPAQPKDTRPKPTTLPSWWVLTAPVASIATIVMIRLTGADAVYVSCAALLVFVLTTLSWGRWSRFRKIRRRSTS